LENVTHDDNSILFNSEDQDQERKQSKYI
jgi:hypothetical protein